MEDKTLWCAKKDLVQNLMMTERARVLDPLKLAEGN